MTELFAPMIDRVYENCHFWDRVVEVDNELIDWWIDDKADLDKTLTMMGVDTVGESGWIDSLWSNIFDWCEMLGRLDNFDRPV